MALKRKTLSSRRPSATPGSESRSKRRHDSPSSSSSPKAKGRLFVATRKVHSGRFLEFDYFDREGLRISSWMRAQGWEKVCTVEESTYPDLVREFFENIKFADPKINSTVKGIKISLDERRIGQLLEVPRSGIDLLELNDKVEALKTVLERDEVDEELQLMTSHLSVEVKLLHAVVTNIIIPKIGRMDWISKKELAMLFLLMTGTPVNFPAIFMQHLKDCARKCNASLPYGMFFTLIFKEFGVSLSGEDFKKMAHTDYFNEKTMNRMKFVKKDEVWVKIDDLLTEAPGSPAAAAVPAAADTPPAENPAFDPAAFGMESPRTPPAHRSPTPTAPPPPQIDFDELTRKIVDEVTTRVTTQVKESLALSLPEMIAESVSSSLTQKIVKTVKGLKDDIWLNLENQRIAAEGQFEMISQQISGLSGRLEIVEKEGLASSAQIEDILKHTKMIAVRLQENLDVQCVAAQRTFSALQQIAERVAALGPKPPSGPSSSNVKIEPLPTPPSSPDIQFMNSD